MSLVINHNMMAMRTANALDAQYGQLATSTQRLSTGLRINSAADDAAGLAIRELQRADIATLHQGARNANDAVSMIQTADGALAIIDEKLIRMKELAEQAATGTYDSTQRLMIASEFEQMASEIDRIANATDFNGIKLLDGSLNGGHDGSGMTSTGAMKVHFGTGNDSAEDYYYINIGSCNVLSLFEPDDIWPGATVKDGKYVLELTNKTANNWIDTGLNGLGLDHWEIPSGLKNVRIKARNGDTPGAHKPHVNLFSVDGTQLTGYSPNSTATINGYAVSEWWGGKKGEEIVQHAGFNAGAVFDDTHIRNNAGETVAYGDLTIHLEGSQNEVNGDWEVITIEEVKDDLLFLIGGHNNNHCNVYDLTISCDIPYPSIETQEKAQEMLPRIDAAIVKKDSIRAHLGAMQNRLENTITNLNTQAENLQAAESRISDVDIATEMTEFVRRQILTQSATAMLAQANSLPQMAMQIIGGQG